MNENIGRFVAYTLVLVLCASVLAVATLPAVLAWWDQSPYWLLLYLTYPVAFVSIAATIGSAKSSKEKRPNSDEYC